MFERFTKQAQLVVVEAQGVARELNHTQIDTNHLLLAIMGDPEQPAARALLEAGIDRDRLRAEVAKAHGNLGPDDAEALAALGIDLDAVREKVEEAFGPGALDKGGPRRRGGHIPFSKEAKKTLELSLREAIRLKDRSIGTEHILLGILRAEGEGHAALRALGVDVAALRRALERGEAA